MSTTSWWVHVDRQAWRETAKREEARLAASSTILPDPEFREQWDTDWDWRVSKKKALRRERTLK